MRLRIMTGKERRLMNPNRGLIKLFERYMDMAISRYVYPLFGHIWSPYSWLLERRFTLAETKLAPSAMAGRIGAAASAFDYRYPRGNFLETGNALADCP